MAEIYLSIGSNVGDRLFFIKDAITGIKKFCQVHSISSVYETVPWGFTEQDLFLNICISASTDLEPLELLTKIKSLEKQIGRQKTFKWGPRAIDIDIVLYGKLILVTPKLTLPQKQMEERGFVLIPLREINPDLVHPVLSKSISELCEGINETEIQIYKSQPFQ